ncbi:hypothetical protein SB6411_02117 [Klebsiella spallanzanii]|uniref:Uncharacterized protein n=1 Tax=Klebsiella spallanzanii TaxID=2587528 RepID=A0ABY6VFN3_9ENTR|nr:hypothetical protein [Klebsiella spallanzanii]VUS65623.1 hypothetical protein SB6411_02117 [Klebsiella spallanzanii]
MEYGKMRIRDFLADNWSLFEAFCAENGDDPEAIEKVVTDE